MDEHRRTPRVSCRRRAAAAGAVTLILLVLPLAGSPPASNPNELVRIELAVAMALWATVDLENAAHVYGLSEDVARSQGRILADKAPGLSMAGAPVVGVAAGLLPSIPGTDLPAYWPLRHLMTLLLIVPGAIMGGVMVVRALQDIRPPRTGVPLFVIACLCSPLWTYATVFLSHAAAAGLVATSWVLLDPRRPDSDTGLRWFVGGLAGGFAVTTEYPTAILVAVVAITLAVRRASPRAIGAVAAGLAVGVLPMLLYHQIAFGAPHLTGYAFKADPGFDAIHSSGVAGISLPTLEGLWGVLFGASRGLIFYAPVLLLAPVGWWIMARRDGWKQTIPLVVAVGLYTLFAAGFVDWQAGWCAAARHLVPLVPLLLIPTSAAMLAMLRHRWGAIVAAVLAALSVTRAALTVAISPFFPPEFSDPLRQLVVPGLRDGAATPNLITWLTGTPAPAVVIAGTAMAVAAVIWALVAIEQSRWRRILVAFLITVLAQLGGLARPSAPPDPDREALRAQWLARLGHTATTGRLMDEGR
jgi:hypothetical protein